MPGAIMTRCLLQTALSIMLTYFVCTWIGIDFAVYLAVMHASSSNVGWPYVPMNIGVGNSEV